MQDKRLALMGKRDRNAMEIQLPELKLINQPQIRVKLNQRTETSNNNTAVYYRVRAERAAGWEDPSMVQALRDRRKRRQLQTLRKTRSTARATRQPRRARSLGPLREVGLPDLLPDWLRQPQTPRPGARPEPQGRPEEPEARGSLKQKQHNVNPPYLLPRLIQTPPLITGQNKSMYFRA